MIRESMFITPSQYVANCEAGIPDAMLNFDRRILIAYFRNCRTEAAVAVHPDNVSRTCGYFTERIKNIARKIGNAGSSPESI